METTSHNLGGWEYLPYLALYKVFEYLDYKSLIAAGTVCQGWFKVSRDEFLWKELFYSTFHIRRSVSIVAGKKSWYEEFRRLCQNVPMVQTEILKDHTHQVLHVSFSHDGKYFATCSKDGYVLLWNSAYPASIKYHRDMKQFSWKYTQYSQFNESDTLLLVSGVHFGTPHSTSGEIAVFNIQDGFQLQCRVVNKPYDIFGTWYSDEHLLSGDLHWLAHLVSTSFLWLNKASQEADSEHVPITHNMFRFYNRNASSIRSIMIANCLPNSEKALEDKDSEDGPSKQAQGTHTERGNPISHRDMSAMILSHNFDQSEFRLVEKLSDHCDPSYPYPICYNSDYRKSELEYMDFGDTDSEDEISPNPSTDSTEDYQCDDYDDGSDISQDSDAEQIVQNDKYLIFTTGSKTYTPHQIAFKRIRPFSFPKKLDPGPSLKERLVLHERRMELLRSGSPPPDPNWLDYDSVAEKFDKIDHLIDLHGHIVGMGLSPDHRYLYVNCRSWPYNYEISNPLEPPPIAQEIDIHVIDLVTLKQVGTMLRAHKAHTPNSECFFIFLDVCNEYVASGAEDKHGYLWDRHYGICLAKFPHADVVNSVAFNPKDSSMLVTTSDDNTVKIWRSKAKVRELGLDVSDFQAAAELSRRKQRSNSSAFASKRTRTLRTSENWFP